VITVEGTERMAANLLAIGKDLPIAQMRAINRTLEGAKTRASAAIVADLGGGITKRAVDRSLHITKASPRTLEGTLAIGPYRRTDGKPPHVLGRIPMQDFRPYQLLAGVQAGSLFAPRAFLATMRSGHKAVVGRRRGAGPTGLVGRLPIDERFGPSPLRVFNAKLVDENVATAREQFRSRLVHEINFILSQRAGREAA
jgi:hypothetical protein